MAAFEIMFANDVRSVKLIILYCSDIENTNFQSVTLENLLKKGPNV